MVFSSTVFLFVFFPITIIVYFALRNTTLRNLWLLIMSLVFYGWSQPEYMFIIILNILINYSFPIMMGILKRYKKVLLFFAISMNLAILFVFKYLSFVVETINSVMHGAIDPCYIALPIGISFFTFQGLSYVIDVYRDKVKVQRNILVLGLYIVLFPQLVAGPIVRYSDIENEINHRVITIDSFVNGLERFIIGLGKKVIIANTMAVAADSIWSNLGFGITTGTAWIGSIAYSLQILFDFSGYSDMAIGLGGMLGFTFPENFNLPYTATSITDFWRRWHISLSSWFRDYVYIPLGGNKSHVYRNLIIVFLLTGIWHGAAWTFVLWGVWNGLFILLERSLRGKVKLYKKNAIIDHLYLLLIVNIGWVIFRAPDVASMFEYIGAMFGMTTDKTIGLSAFWFLDRWSLFIMIIGILLSSGIQNKIAKRINSLNKPSVSLLLNYIGLLLIFSFSVIRIVSGTYNPFIYFQF